MPKFRYLAVDHGGRMKRGTIEAPDFRAAADELRNAGLWVMRIIQRDRSLLLRPLPALTAPRVKSEHFTVFCRQLATLYKSGVGILEGLQVLSGQTESKPLRKVLRDMAEDIRNGYQMSEAASKFPTVFSSIFVNMVRAGEESGRLDEMLERLAVYYEKEHHTRAKLQAAMIYPIAIGILTMIVSIFMLIAIVPRYMDAFRGMGVELPLPTRMLIFVSDLLRESWPVFPLLIVLAFLVRRLIRRLPNGRLALDRAKLRIPVFGPLRRRQIIARLTRTFGSLHAAAIPIMQTLSLAAGVVGNEAMKRVVLDARERAASGQPIADAFRESSLFPPMVAQMIAIGERSGAIDVMLDKIADFFEADADRMADRLKSLLEPFMILFMALVVGGIVSAMMLPVFRILNVTGNMGMT